MNTSDQTNPNREYLEATSRPSVYKLIKRGNLQEILLEAIPEKSFFTKHVLTLMLCEKLMKEIPIRRIFYFPVMINGKKAAYRYDFLGQDIVWEEKSLADPQIVEVSEYMDMYFVFPEN